MKTIEKLSVKIGIEIMEKYSTTIDYTPMFEDAAMRMAEELERWIPIEEELPPLSNDESGFGDIRSEDVIVKDEYENYDIKKYDHLAKMWTGSRNVIPRFWKYIE